MSVKSPIGLVLYCYLNMPTINKTYLILSYLILSCSQALVAGNYPPFYSMIAYLFSIFFIYASPFPLLSCSCSCQYPYYLMITAAYMYLHLQILYILLLFMSTCVICVPFVVVSHVRLSSFMTYHVISSTRVTS